MKGRLRAMWLHAGYRVAYARPDDTWLASYPRSGNTWLRWMLHDVLFEPSDEFVPVRTRIPDIHRGLSGFSNDRARFIKTHFLYTSLYRKVVYLIRDPVDAMVSLYQRRDRVGSPQISFDDFVELELRGKGPYGSWDRHVDSYLCGALPKESLLLVRYEEMIADPATALRNILEFGGVTCSVEQARRVATLHMDRLLGPDEANAPVDYESKCSRVMKYQRSKGLNAMREESVRRILDSRVGQRARELGYVYQ